MSKNTIYLIATILMLIIIAIIWFPKSAALPPAASPANGLMDSAHVPASAEKPASEAIRPVAVPAPAAAIPATDVAPTSQAVPESAASQKAMDADDVPAGAEVAPVPQQPNIPKPTDDKGLVVPPAEGR